MTTTTPTPDARSRRIRRALPVLLLALLAFIVGAVVGRQGGPEERQLADRYAQAWQAGDYAAMHAELTDEAQQRYPLARFTQYHRDAAETATLRRLRAGAAKDAEDHKVTVPFVARTNAFGTLRSSLTLPIDAGGDEPRVAWEPYLTLPGVQVGERLRRETQLPERANLLARDGTPLAQGSARTSNLGPEVTGVVGELGPVPASRAAQLRTLGIPAGTKVGITGLERAFDERLLGTPGGTLYAGDRPLARTAPKPASGVRTSIDVDVQRAAASALAGRYGGVAVVRPKSGEVLALSGIALDGLQPPGSTFKMITAAAGLEAGLAKPSTVYPVETSATLSGVELENANGESCGGTLTNSFAHSCNSVFAPLGAKVGAKKLVETAEQFGFNQSPGLPGAATSTIPAADKIGDDLAVGSTAIGQGMVQATALQMAWTASTIANRGERPQLTLALGERPRRVQAVPKAVARDVGKFMQEVVGRGTGIAAQIPGVKVAGKTGTAELRQTQGDCQPAASTDGEPAPAETCAAGENDPSDTDAWFAAYAPAGQPRVAVGVLLVGAGTGGDTAAPAARNVLLAALKRGS